MYGVGFLRGLLWDERLVYLGKELFFFFVFFDIDRFFKGIWVIGFGFFG